MDRFLPTVPLAYIPLILYVVGRKDIFTLYAKARCYRKFGSPNFENNCDYKIGVEQVIKSQKC